MAVHGVLLLELDHCSATVAETVVVVITGVVVTTGVPYTQLIARSVFKAITSG
jgi:hypothetical protein